MICRLFILLVLLCIYLKEVELRQIKQEIDTPCGEIIPMLDVWNGTIRYKPTQNYSANERCVWTLRGPDVSLIEFVLLESGINGADPYEGIFFTGLSRTAPEGIRQTAFIRETGTASLENVDVIIVTFVSGSLPLGTGFVLNYTATPSETRPTSLRSVDFISNSVNGSLTHPAAEHGNYDNYEISTFLIAPPGFNVDSQPTVHTEWNMKSIEGGCLDLVWVYKFYTDAGYSRFDTYCETPATKLLSHTDMVLLVFKSDFLIVSTGFILKWHVD